VKQLKLGILICGALGLVGMALSGLGMMLQTDRVNTAIMLIAFAIPVVMGAIPIVRPPLQSWQAGVALACFVLTAVKLRLWSAIHELGHMQVGGKLVMAATILGVIVTITAMLKPEP
jgi:hypothetical protein